MGWMEESFQGISRTRSGQQVGLIKVGKGSKMTVMVIFSSRGHEILEKWMLVLLGSLENLEVNQVKILCFGFPINGNLGFYSTIVENFQKIEILFVGLL